MSLDLKTIRNETKPAQPQPGRKNLLEVLNTQITFRGPGLSDKFKEQFYGELALLLKAGLDIQQAFDLLGQEQGNKKWKVVIGKLAGEVIGGRGLAEVMEGSKGFESFEVFTIRIGEETGDLASVCEDLAGHFKRRQDVKRQLIGVLTYPVFVLLVSLGVLYFMLKYIVPMFADVFGRFDAELPGLTKGIIAISNWVGRNGVWFLAGGIVIFALTRIIGHRPEYRKWHSFWLMKLPLFGPLITKLHVARFCQAMNILLRSSIPLTQALDLVRKMSRFYPIEVACESLIRDVTGGSSLEYAMRKFPVFPSRLVALVKLGEEVNKLDELFGRYARDLSEEVDHRSKLIGKLLEPVLILLIGILVGIILIGMYLPMFEMSRLMR